MFVKFHRASWRSIFAAFAVFPLLGLASVLPASAQSRISVSVSPLTASVQAGGGSQQFIATVRNDRHKQGVRWTLSSPGCSGSACGTLSATTSASGTPITYTAPSNVPNPAAVTLRATSISNTAKRASATITITGSSAAPMVTISPNRCSSPQPFKMTLLLLV
jgi:Tfp pilus assembly protein PilW